MNLLFISIFGFNLPLRNGYLQLFFGDILPSKYGKEVNVFWLAPDTNTVSSEFLLKYSWRLDLCPAKWLKTLGFGNASITKINRFEFFFLK